MIYTAPDIRQKTLAECEAHLNMKRAQRMVLVQSYQEKLAAKLERAEADGQERYAKRLLALRNKLAKIGQEIERADAQLTVLQKTHNDLTATERAIKDL